MKRVKPATRDELLIGDILIREGGSTFTNDPDDPGGPTKWGITQKTLARCLGREVNVEDVKNLTRAKAVEIYATIYIYEPNFHKLLHDELFRNVVDTAVHSGPRRATKLLQEALGFTGSDVDGILGPKTLSAANNPGIVTYMVVKAFKVLRTDYLFRLVERSPELAKFEKGWIRRAIAA